MCGRTARTVRCGGGRQPKDQSERRAVPARLPPTLRCGALEGPGHRALRSTTWGRGADPSGTPASARQASASADWEETPAADEPRAPWERRRDARFARAEAGVYARAAGARGGRPKRARDQGPRWLPLAQGSGRRVLVCAQGKYASRAGREWRIHGVLREPRALIARRPRPFPPGLRRPQDEQVPFDDSRLSGMAGHRLLVRQRQQVGGPRARCTTTAKEARWVGHRGVRAAVAPARAPRHAGNGNGVAVRVGSALDRARGRPALAPRRRRLPAVARYGGARVLSVSTKVSKGRPAQTVALVVATRRVSKV